MRRSVSTQELVNIFPSWSRIREDNQSIGYQLLNTIGVPIERMDKEITRMERNQFLSTANLDEVDLFYKVELPTTFSFDTDTTDPLRTLEQAPTVSGTVSGLTFLVLSTQKNSIESVWYKASPTRITIGSVVTGTDDVLLDLDVSSFPQEGEFDHHLGGGSIYLETASGVSYFTLVDGEIVRAQIILTGTTRKGTTDEKEYIIFPWNQRQRSNKEWKQLTKVETANIPSGVQVTVKSGDYNFSDYISPWNLRYSSGRKKVDEFWGLGTINDKAVLNRVGYTTDEWQQLVTVGTEKTTEQSWELLDSNLQEVAGVDLALQPFTDKAWIVTTAGKLYCYDTSDTMVSGVSLLKDRTPGTHVQIEADFREYIFGEDIEFIPWHSRPVKEISRYRLYYRDPTGTVSGLDRGTPVPFTSDFFIRGQQLKRTIEDVVILPTTHRGEYVFTLEVVFIDGEEHTEKVIFRTNSKRPEVEFDISSVVDGTIQGLEFDADQKLWVKTSTGYHQIELHYDVMLVDFINKVLYFKEKYDTVDVITNG